MSTLLQLWTALLPDTLTPAQVDADLHRHGLDPQDIRRLVNGLSRTLDPIFAAGVLAGIRFALVCRHRGRAHVGLANQVRGRVIPFPDPAMRARTVGIEHES